MIRQTPLNVMHRASGARMVDFGGWDMPLHYGSQIEEHHAVRRKAGMFDVSHMAVVDLHGAQVRPFLGRLLANDVAKLTRPGRALYTCMLNERGGVLDDLICYYVEDDHFRIVVNAGRRDADIAWIREHAAPFGLEVLERGDLGIVAVQGPEARQLYAAGHNATEQQNLLALARFSAAKVGSSFVARTGYTGEDGFEIIVPTEHLAGLWVRLREAGVQPCGLGARDTLRLEAGMHLYGQDMDQHTTPLAAGLGWTVAWEPRTRDFIGRNALEAQREQGVDQRFVGLVLDERGVLRHGQTVITSAGEGLVTSGSFAPTLGKSIALARIPAAAGDEGLAVDIRGRAVPVRIHKPPFVRNGQAAAGL